MNPGLTINQIAKRLGSERRRVIIALEKEGILKPSPEQGYARYGEDDIAKIKPLIDAAIARCCGKDKVRPDKGPMSIAHQEIAERLRKLTRENEEAEAIQSKRWTLTSDVVKMLSAVKNRIDQIAGVVKSEAGLSDAQTATLQKKIDDTLAEIATDIEGMKA